LHSDNKVADLLADSGGHRVVMEMVSRTAAEAAAKITTTTGTITKFTTANKRGNIGGKKKLRGSDSDKTIINQWTRTGRYFDKIDENGKPYRVEVLACKAQGCRIKRQHKVTADGSLKIPTRATSPSTTAWTTPRYMRSRR
jgi:hypothetical protein